mmetsp:Transcript_27633/g.51836  ORF Transcript_27633/g.51836 Transcript_27633/m.51836 type:complete len:110 (-) Transcript_27633:528-857(-)
MVSTTIIKEGLQHECNPTPDCDIAPSTKLYQTYLRKWYQHVDADHRDTSPTVDDDFRSIPPTTKTTQLMQQPLTTNMDLIEHDKYTGWQMVSHTEKLLAHHRSTSGTTA